MSYRFGVVIPTYGHLDYARSAVDSLFACTPKEFEPVAIVVDDATPHFHEEYAKVFHSVKQEPWAGQLHSMHFQVNGGLTRSWNAGILALANVQCTHIVATNSDILFTPYWWNDLLHATDAEDFALVGPVTNAPGTEAHQCVTNFDPSFKVSDDWQYLDTVAAALRSEWFEEVREAPLNGFFLFAQTKRWLAGMYDHQHVFCPRNERNSKGEPNPTPLMTLNEYELQRRWKEKGWKIGFCPGSFVFHYRAVSRGDKYKRGLWHRKAK